MSAPLEELKKAAEIDVKDHTAIFDHYIALDKDVEQIAIKFGYDIPMIITILTGYGETISDKAKGRLDKLSRILVEEYIERFYPGIASENPENDWITIEAYLDAYHKGWRDEVAKKIVAERRKMIKAKGLEKPGKDKK